MSERFFWQWIALSMVLLFTVAATAQSVSDRYIPFHRLTLEDGLPSNNVISALHDSRGLMWFATSHGLARYDGTNVRAFTVNPNDSNGLANGNIDNLIETDDGFLWLATDDGLVRFDPFTAAFTTYRFNETDAALTTKANRLRPLAADERGRIWVGSEYGVRVFDRNSGSEVVAFLNNDREGFTREDVYSLFVDSKGRAWVGGIGLRVFNAELEEEFRYMPFPDRDSGYNLFRRFYETADGSIWACGDFGIMRWSGTSREPQVWSTEHGVPNRFLWTMAQDAGGRFWIANYAEGIVVFDPVAETFETLRPNPSAPAGLPTGAVTQVVADREGRFWACMEGAGVAWFDPELPGCQMWQLNPANQLSGENGVSAIAPLGPAEWVAATSSGLYRVTNPGSVNQAHEMIDPDSRGYDVTVADGRIYVADFGDGVDVYDFDGNKLERLTRVGGYDVHNCYRLLADRDQHIWVATMGEGLTRFWPGEAAVTNLFPRDTLASYLASSVVALHQDRSGYVWAAVPREGVFRIAADGKITDHYHRGSSSRSLSNNNVNALLEDHAGNIWFALDGAGVDRLDPTTGEVRNYGPASGLPNPVVHDLLEDSQQRIWLVTAVGLSCLDPTTGTIRSYGESFGLPANINSIQFAANGDLLATSGAGIARIPLAFLEAELPLPKLVVSGISINNEALNVAADQLDSLVLDPDMTRLQVSMQAIEFRHTEHARCMYRLLPEASEWRTVPATHTATWANLPQGNYTLEIKTAFDWGEAQTEVRTLHIRVRAPWYQRTWAVVMFSLLLLLLFWMVLRVRTRILQREKDRLETIVAERTQQIATDKALIEEQAEQLKRMDEVKNRFFANISHELRTPLTLILGPLESFFAQDDQLDNRQQKFLSVMKENGRKLMLMVEEILDLSRLDASRLELQPEAVALNALVKRLLFSFESGAERKGVALKLDYQLPEHAHYQLDAGRIEKIVTNLLSNALKFTRSGSITVTVGQASDPANLPPGAYLQLRVTDTGAGIHPDDLPYVFERYFQSNQPNAPVQGGTGIGLALSKELALLHGGELTATSELGKGSVFTLLVPLVETAAREQAGGEPQTPQPDAITIPAQLKAGEPTILVVEDHPEMSDYIRQLLEAHFNVVCLPDGLAAWNWLQQQTPDLITSDVMMPNMDGFELLRKVKREPRLASLPMLMLTARGGDKDRLDALSLGVDDYLTKPFIADELIARVRNLLENKHNRQQFQDTKPAHEQSGKDQQFIQKLETLALANLHDSSYKIGQIAPELGVSERQLFREINRITGITPGKFLREIRLQHARAMLENKEATTVAEVCYAVGFEKPGYFSKLFYERFGRLPSTYL